MRVAIAVVVIGIIQAGCTVDVKDKGEPPDVEVQGGRAPDIDIEPPNIEVTRDTQVVEVPRVEVEPPDQP